MTQTDFDPNEHLIQLKSKAGDQDYLPVQWRLVWFRDKCPGGTISTELVHLDLDRECVAEAYVWNAQTRKSEKVMKTVKGIAVFRATITDGNGGSATGTGSESAADFNDFIEKAETKAIGRALAGLGYGTQFAPELNEGSRIADAPVASNGNPPQQTQRAAPVQTQQTAKATEQQIAAIRKLCTHVNMSEPENMNSMTFLEAKALLQELTTEYKAQRQQHEQPTHAAAPVGQSKALLEMIAKAKGRVEAISMIWDSVKGDTLQKIVPDSDLTVQQVAAINGTITTYERGTKPVAVPVAS